MSEAPKIHSAELAGYSSIVGQPIMLLDAEGACIGQLALIGVQDGYEEMVAEVADALNTPIKHAYRIGVVVGREGAFKEGRRQGLLAALDAIRNENTRRIASSRLRIPALADELEAVISRMLGQDQEGEG